jgi:2-methylcitrate dehydratase PrpD
VRSIGVGSRAADPHATSTAHVVEQAGRFAVAFRTCSLEPALAHHAKRALIDWSAAALAGAALPPATLLERAFAGELRRGDAELVRGGRAPARLAALVNGSAAHTAEVDDIFREAIFHPGAPTIAAALALAPARGLDGVALLRAVIVGYEICTRIGVTMGRAHYARWHNTGTIGSFGAAAAAAEVLGLDERAFAHALATVATFAAGLQQAFRSDSMSKPLHAGRAAEAGVTAALAAAAGVTGALDVLEGAIGFGASMIAPAGEPPDWRGCMATLGSDFHVARMTFKNHACCGHAFAAIDGALALRARLGVAAADIDSVEIGTYGEALQVAGNPAPRTAAEARFSLPFVVATALVHGSVRLAAFEPARLANPGLRALMARIRVVVDPALDAAFPAQRAARVAIRTRSGTSDALLQPTRKGDPDAPLSDEELSDKFLELAAPVCGTTAAAALLGRLWSLEALPSVAGLFEVPREAPTLLTMPSEVVDESNISRVVL